MTRQHALNNRLIGGKALHFNDLDYTIYIEDSNEFQTAFIHKIKAYAYNFHFFFQFYRGRIKSCFLWKIYYIMCEFQLLLFSSFCCKHMQEVNEFGVNCFL